MQNDHVTLDLLPLPNNEQQRLTALHSYEILDTAPEVDFDALTRIATHTLRTPAAVIGLLDANRLWFKSRIGLEVPELDRSIAFCAHAIMNPGEVLVINDLSKDSRFTDNPLVVNPPHLKFYAGAPLVDSNGFALGTIAVVDLEPRTLSDQEEALLQDLSTLVVAVLENRYRAQLLSHLAMTDYLTGLGNRAHFSKCLATEMAHSSRHGEPLSLLCLDLNGFKAVNDKWGHLAGDEVLREIARRLQEIVRSEDIVCRLGGDEFALITRRSSLAAAHDLAERIRKMVLLPVELSNGQQVKAGISIGIAEYANETSADQLFAKADNALYEQKRRDK